MKQVQSAEFRKGFAAETEPVEVMKYREVLGTWYPAGTETPEKEADEIIDYAVSRTREIEALREEVKQLKRLLAARANKVEDEPKTVDAAIAALPKQDREFFEKRLGKKK